MKRIFIIAVLLIAGLLAGVLTAHWQRSAAAPEVATLFATPRLLDWPALVDERGDPISASSFSTEWDLLFFGFTRCPDICPMTLGRLRTAIGQLPADERPRVWLVSVDPTHDKSEVLRDYLAFFDASFRGLTGTEAQIESLATQLGVAYSRVPQEEGYTMSHSAALFLLDREGRYAGLFTTPHDWPTISQDLARIVN
ncbi:MAG: SCO family protein [Gammaproteobacteria bacterium]|nr:SCO family protein [Gammaproteobacteria bacterium]